MTQILINIILACVAIVLLLGTVGAILAFVGAFRKQPPPYPIRDADEIEADALDRWYRR